MQVGEAKLSSRPSSTPTSVVESVVVEFSGLFVTMATILPDYAVEIANEKCR